MDINDFISTDEAAKKLDYDKCSIAFLCRKGKLKGAVKIGGRWFVPRETVENYVKAPQGYAAIWERRRKAEKKEAENYFLDSETSECLNNEEHSEEYSEKKDIHMEILKSLKILIKEVRKLGRAIAREDPVR